jgi:hypothetical protein
MHRRPGCLAVQPASQLHCCPPASRQSCCWEPGAAPGVSLEVQTPGAALAGACQRAPPQGGAQRGAVASGHAAQRARHTQCGWLLHWLPDYM